MKVQRVVPILNVSDVEASFQWFAKLGWTESFRWRGEDGRGPLSFGGVVCDGSEMFLCLDGQGSRGHGHNTTTGPGDDQRRLARKDAGLGARRNRVHNAPLERSGRHSGTFATWDVINVPR